MRRYSPPLHVLIMTLLALTFSASDIMPAYAAPGTVAALGAPASNSAVNSLAYTVQAGNNRLLVVTVSDASSTTIGAVTFDASSMTNAVILTDGYAVDGIFYLLLGSSASTTAGTISVAGGSSYKVITAQAFSDVDQTTPIDGTMQAKANGALSADIGSSLTIAATTAGDLVFDLFDGFRITITPTVTPDASQTAIHNVPLSPVPEGNGRYGTSSKSASGPNTNMSWTSTAEAMIHVAANINAAAPPPAPTASIVVADTDLRISETSLVTFTFSEAVTGFTNADLTVPNGTLTAVSSGDGGVTWTTTFTPTAGIEDATNVITLDKTGVSSVSTSTPGIGTTDSNNYQVDTKRPTATIVVADTDLRNGETSLVTFTFSEAVTGFTNADLTVPNGTLTAVSSSDGGVTWTATLTPTAGIEDATNVITLDNTGISDSAGNAGTGSTDSNNYAVATQADLSITKTDGVATATPGGSVTYTITASNAGPSNATGATVADTFPASLTGTWTCVGAGGGTCTAAGSGNINDTVNLPAGASVTYTVSASISGSATGTMSNTATVSSAVTDPNSGNNSATDTDALNAQADLAITKTDGVATATPGGSVTYTITASNAGPSNATGATVADTFPASLTGTWTCVGAGGGTCTAAGSGTINDTVNLPAGGSVTYTVSATISASATGTLSNTATVSSAVTDPNPGNNSATDTDALNAQADLAITKTDGVVSATPGGSVTYTITASNAGPSNASGATVADTLPAALTGTWTCVGAGGGTCTAAGSGNISDTVNLPAGGSVTYTVSASVSASATGTLSNTAMVSSAVTDPNPGNNSATDTDTLSASADLAITKTDGVATATPGGSVTYTITASNAGPSNATGATVADTFPASLTGTWTCVGAGGGTCTAAGSGNINDTVNLPAGASVTYTVSASISGSATGSLSNTATVTTSAGVTDLNPGNNSATDIDSVFTAATSQGNASCHGGADGSATVTPNGGTEPYYYAWSPSGGTEATATGLAAGDYTCTITDSGTLSITKTFTITEPAAPIVTNGNDNGTGSLRQAITNACDDGTITFAGDYTITLASQLTIDKNLTIDGGANAVTVSGGNATRVFYINNGVSCSLQNLTVADGNAGENSGGGAYNDNGTLTVTNCTFSCNSAAWSGGGIASFSSGGTVTLTGSTISGNSAGGSGGGIASFSGGDVTLTDSTITGNSAGASGGGIDSSGGGDVTLTGSTIAGNSAGRSGGGIDSSGGGTVTLTDSTIAGNSTVGNGGGIESNGSGTVTLTDSTISGNSSGEDGGGIDSSCSTVTLTDSTITGNSAGRNGGGIDIRYNGTVTLTSSTMGDNTANSGGGIHIYEGTVTLASSTLDNNTADDGGGIYIEEGEVTLTGSTIAGNSGASGGGIYNSAGILNLSNTLIANSVSGGDCLNVNGTIGISKHNLIQATGSDACGLTDGVDGNIIGIDPLLAALGDYGGPTQTIALLPGSAAIDAGDPDNCTATDQRGVARPQGVGCDIGAFESRGFTLEIAGGDGQSAQITTPFASPLSVTVTADNASEPVDGGQVTFTAPASGASAAIAGSTVTITSGSASVTATANDTEGAYSVTAEAAGGNQLIFALENTALPVTTTTTTVPADDCLTSYPAQFTKLLFDRREGRALMQRDDDQLQPAELIAIMRMLRVVVPLQAVVFVGGPDTEFSRDDKPVWSPEGIKTFLKFRLTPRTMFALVLVNPFATEAGTYEVTIGDCSGTVELLEP